MTSKTSQTGSLISFHTCFFLGELLLMAYFPNSWDKTMYPPEKTSIKSTVQCLLYRLIDIYLSKCEFLVRILYTIFDRLQDVLKNSP